MKKHEYNPFENGVVAKEWIIAVENEHGAIRDNDIYPRLRAFAEKHPTGTILEIGSGQGVCSSELGDHTGTYIGIEPAERLRERADELYGKSPNRSFLAGNAYELPLGDNSVDQIFSVGLWFHLADLPAAAAEMSRVLRPGGTFFIVTSSPDSHTVWESMFFEHEKQGNLISGKIRTLSGNLSRSDFYLHEIKDSNTALTSVGLTVTEMEHFGEIPEQRGRPLMIGIMGVC